MLAPYPGAKTAKEGHRTRCRQTGQSGGSAARSASPSKGSAWQEAQHAMAPALCGSSYPRRPPALRCGLPSVAPGDALRDLHSDV